MPDQGLVEKLEQKYPVDGSSPCTSYDDQGTLATRISDLATTVAASVPGLSNPCDAVKIVCISKHEQGIFGIAFNPKTHLMSAAEYLGALAEAANKLTGPKGCFYRAHLKDDGPCTSTSDGAVLQAVSEQFLEDVICVTDPANPGCATPTPTPTPTP